MRSVLGAFFAFLFSFSAATAGINNAGSSGSAPTSLALTDVPASGIFQRSAGQTTGPVAISGTYGGGSPTAVQGQVLKVSDNSVVLDWTNLTSASISGGAWSGKVPTVPQGGSYYLKVRAANATSVGATGSNGFYVGIVFALYGQSNMGGLTSVAASPPAASANTAFVSTSTHLWGAVPGANGIRELLNAVTASTGVPCGAINGSVTGAVISFLMDETPSGGLGQFYSAMTTAGVTDAEMVLWMHGEAAANTNPPTIAADYKANVSTLHGLMAAHFGRTKAQLPFVIEGLTTYGGTPGANTDDTWSRIRTALFEIPQEQPFTHFSHSNMDGVRAPADVYHLDGASQGRAGKRLAQTVKFLLGLGGGEAHFEITASAVIDATHTDITVAHSSGATDISPASGITGFDVTGDNGATWITATGARQSASVVRLTHASIATDSRRKARYQYGMLPDVSAPVADNSTLALPLTYTRDELMPTPLSVVPVLSYRFSNSLVGSGTSQTMTGVPIGPAAIRRMIVLSLEGTGGISSGISMTVTPNVGTVKSATQTKPQGGSNGVSIWQAVLDADADTATQIDVAVTYVSNPFGGNRLGVWTIPSGDLVSTTATGTGGASSAVGTGATTVNATVNASAGGVILAVSRSTHVAGTDSAAISSGSGETFAQRQARDNTFNTVIADASQVAANAASSVTATYTNGASGAGEVLTIALAAWR